MKKGVIKLLIAIPAMPLFAVAAVLAMLRVVFTFLIEFPWSLSEKWHNKMLCRIDDGIKWVRSNDKPAAK